MKRDGSTKFWSLQVRDGSVERRKKHRSLGHISMLWTSLWVGSPAVFVRRRFGEMQLVICTLRRGRPSDPPLVCPCSDSRYPPPARPVLHCSHSSRPRYGDTEEGTEKVHHVGHRVAKFSSSGIETGCRNIHMSLSASCPSGTWDTNQSSNLPLHPLEVLNVTTFYTPLVLTVESQEASSLQLSHRNPTTSIVSSRLATDHGDHLRRRTTSKVVAGPSPAPEGLRYISSSRLRRQRPPCSSTVSHFWRPSYTLCLFNRGGSATGGTELQP